LAWICGGSLNEPADINRISLKLQTWGTPPAKKQPTKVKEVLAVDAPVKVEVRPFEPRK